MSEQLVRDYIAGVTELISIVYNSSAWGAKFLGAVLGFPIITQIDEDAVNGVVNRNRVNNRVHNFTSI
jgi:hypothetical protein